MVEKYLPKDSAWSLKSFALTLVLFTSALLSSCAGPYHPFGSEDLLDNIQAEESHHSHNEDLAKHPMALHRLPASDADRGPRILPLAQRYHREHLLRIKIPSKSKNFRIFYNQKDVTNEALQMARETSHQIIIPNFRLSSGKKHNIVFTYTDEKNKVWEKVYPSPTCQWRKTTSIQNPQNLLQRKRARKEVHYQAKEHGLNPNFLAALIAIEDKRSDTNWNKYVNRKVQAIQKIKEYWRRPHHQLLFQSTFQSDQISMTTDFLLANLEEGTYRLKRALQLKGKEWKRAPFLDSHSYEQKIKSHCFDFAHKTLSFKEDL